MTMISSAAGQPPASRSVSSAFAGGFAGGLVRLLGSLADGVVTYFVRREAIKTLRELDDRALRDIGIERSRIETAVRGVVDPEFGRIAARVQ